VVGARTVYTRFDRYRPRADGPTGHWTAGPKQVHLDRVEWHVMPDPSTALAALRGGEMDWWENPPNDLLGPLRRDRNLVLPRLNTLGVLGTGVFNHLHPPFDNPAIRRVVLQEMSQQDFMVATAGTEPDKWHVPVGVFAPGTPMANDAALDLVRQPLGIEAARRALAAAGYRGERTVLLIPSDQPALMALGEMARDLLVRLGFNVDAAVSDWGTLVQRRASMEPVEKGGWSMFQTTWAAVDLVNPVGTQVLRANGRRGYFGWPDVPRLEALREAWLDATTLADQQRLAREIQQVTLEQAVFMPTGQYFGQSAHRRELQSVVNGVIAFWNVRKG
jgi:peptide/nickel transport system substrate-binding protein